MGLLTTGMGVNDYTQPIEKDPKFQPVGLHVNISLGHSLQQLHRRTMQGDVSFLTFRMSANKCTELDYLYRKFDYNKLKYLQYHTLNNELEIENEIIKEYSDFATRMCRRALLRNGYVGYWLKCILHAGIVTYIILPMSSFFRWPSLLYN